MSASSWSLSLAGIWSPCWTSSIKKSSKQRANLAKDLRFKTVEVLLQFIKHRSIFSHIQPGILSCVLECENIHEAIAPMFFVDHRNLPVRSVVHGHTHDMAGN